MASVTEWIFLLIVLICIGVAFWYAFAGSKETDESFTERPRVVVSFSTIPSRLPFLRKVEQQITKQTFKPDAVYACIPKRSARLNQEYDLKTNDTPETFTVLRTEDYGPATKLLGCLDMEQDPSTIIITIDDDIDYYDNLIEVLAEMSINNPDCRVGSRANNKLYTNHVKPQSRMLPSHDILLMGFGGIAYRRGMITDSVRKWLQSLPSTDTCWKSDDLTFDRLIKTPKIKVPNLVRKSKTSAENIDALKNDKRKKTYKKCLSSLENLDLK